VEVIPRVYDGDIWRFVGIEPLVAMPRSPERATSGRNR